MDSLENHGIIIRELRRLSALSIQLTAKRINRSPGWLCDVENGTGKCRLLPSEFERIVQLLEGEKHRPMFRTWVANYKNQQRIDKTFDGAVLRFIRLKKGLTFTEASALIGISRAYLCKLEIGAKPMTLQLRYRIMKAYGYNPKSFKNLATDPVRSKAVPSEFKFKIWLCSLTPEQAESFYSKTLSQNL